jgi:hypothetical protein
LITRLTPASSEALWTFRVPSALTLFGLNGSFDQYPGTGLGGLMEDIVDSVVDDFPDKI